jgi:hypothetical protein
VGISEIAKIEFHEIAKIAKIAAADLNLWCGLGFIEV